MAEPVQRAYKYRFYPTAEQRAKLDKYFGHTRWVWNHSLEFRTKAYRRRGESVTGVDYSRLLTRLKRTTRYDWLKEVPASAYSQKLRDQDRAFRNLFEGRARHPRRRKRRMAQSVRLQMDQRQVRKNFDANDQRLVIQGLGQVKLRWSHRPYCPDCTNAPDCPACPKPKMVTVRRDSAGRYFVSFSVEESRREHAPAPLPIVAVDLGLTDFLTDSAGNTVKPYRALARRLTQMRRAQRTLSRRKRRSGRWHAQRQRVGRLHARVADARANFLHHVSRRLVNENQVIVTETLNVRGMIRNRRLARAIADAGWSELVRQIGYKAEWAGREHIAVDQWFPSTKRCSACHEIREGLTLADRRWRCEACGTTHDRDLNAAKNLAQEGLRLLDEQRPGGARLLRVEGDTSGTVPARKGPDSEPASDETRTDSTETRRYGTAVAA